MRLSIVIVNYNVRYFLEQCLYSVENAINGIDSEVFVVDNNSVDGSEAMIRNKFPRVKLILNEHNSGYAKANNQALRLATGDYVLLLNPDTVVEEATFKRCLEFMDSHPQAGALGPKMIDGKGQYLPESKRGLPTPEVAFYKVFGLSKLFPESRRFGKYYFGYTNPNEIQEVEVLTGAFMLIRLSVLQEIGLLDEDFFMYGEDIDLSYRILEKGYKIYYYPETTIIHYKGESTRKGSLNYVIMFYKAMKIFTEKHYSSSQASLYNLLISIAINIRAGFSILKRLLIYIIPVILEAILGFVGLFLIATSWAKLHFHAPNYYPEWFMIFMIPAYILVWLLSVYLYGGYKKPFNIKKAYIGIVIGTALILVIYAILPEQLRFSRLLILFGTIWMLISILFIRLLLSFLSRSDYQLVFRKRRRIVIVGNEEESRRVEQLLLQSSIIVTKIVNVYPRKISPTEYFSGNITQLREIINIYAIDEVIFCAKDISSEDIIEQMKLLIQTKVNFKIASPGSKSVIGSNSARTSGDMYVVSVDKKNSIT
jgi:GT2 family glycosyltransferase